MVPNNTEKVHSVQQQKGSLPAVAPRRRELFVCNDDIAACTASARPSQTNPVMPRPYITLPNTFYM